jgi:basic membrane protein A
MGVFDAAEENHRLAIGVDSNQNWVKPGRILTSMVKAVDEAVYQSIQQEVNGSFLTGVFPLGLQENAISFSVDSDNRSVLDPKIEQRALAARESIIKGTLQVPDYYLKPSSKRTRP